jgi:uncharacterized delta-60 repeat protein
LRVWAGVLCGFLLAVALPASAAAAPGDLDPTFSTNGKVITNVTGGYDWTLGIVVQEDDKLVTSGQASGSGGRFYAVRYLTDGNLDTAFGGDGVVFTNFTSGGDYGYDVAVNSVGKIVVVGSAAGSGRRFALARYNGDGTLDTSFGGDGKVLTNFTPQNDYAFNVAVQSDDKIVAVGHADFSARGRFALARYSSTGALDASFGGDGKVTTNLTGGFDGAWGVAVQTGGRIVATGPADEKVGLVGYTSTGALDNTFGGGDGITRTNWTSGADWTDEIALDVTGRIIVVGIANVFGNDPRYALTRYTADGALDFTKLTNLTGGVDYGLDVAIEPSSQKIVATGAVNNGGRSFVVRHLGGP